MSHFAKVDSANIVLRVIVAEQDFIDSGAVGEPKNWIQTSYNTSRGVHKKGGTALRGNYAGIGFTYDPTLDAFLAPKPYASWALDKTTFSWNAPIPQPNDGKPMGTEHNPSAIGYEWNEGKKQWVVSVEPS